MATLLQIRQRVSRKIKDPSNTSISTADVDYEINRAIQHYQNYRFWFNEDLADITLTSGSNIIPNIPSDVSSELQVNGIMLIDDQVKINLIKLNPAEFFDRDDDQTGRPYFYTYRNNEYLLVPTPNGAYPIKFRYLKTYSPLVNDTDTNDFTEHADTLIMLAACKNIFAEDNQDQEQATAFAALEEKELKSLEQRDSDRNGTGYIYNSSILETTNI